MPEYRGLAFAALRELYVLRAARRLKRRQRGARGSWLSTATAPNGHRHSLCSACASASTSAAALGHRCAFAVALAFGWHAAETPSDVEGVGGHSVEEAASRVRGEREVRCRAVGGPLVGRPARELGLCATRLCLRGCLEHAARTRNGFLSRRRAHSTEPVGVERAARLAAMAGHDERRPRPSCHQLLVLRLARRLALVGRLEFGKGAKQRVGVGGVGGRCELRGLHVHVERRWAAGGGVRAVAHYHVESARLRGRGSGLGLDGLGSGLLGSGLGQLERQLRLGGFRLGEARPPAVGCGLGVAWLLAFANGSDGAAELIEASLLLGRRHVTPAGTLRVCFGNERRHAVVVGGVDGGDAAAGLGLADAELLLVLLEAFRQRRLGVVLGQHEALGGLEVRVLAQVVAHKERVPLLAEAGVGREGRAVERDARLALADLQVAPRAVVGGCRGPDGEDVALVRVARIGHIRVVVDLVEGEREGVAVDRGHDRLVAVLGREEDEDGLLPRADERGDVGEGRDVLGGVELDRVGVLLPVCTALSHSGDEGAYEQPRGRADVGLEVPPVGDEGLEGAGDLEGRLAERDLPGGHAVLDLDLARGEGSRTTSEKRVE